MTDPKWLEWVKRLQAIAQNGLTYATDHWDIERYEAVREIAAEIAAAQTATDLDQMRSLFAFEKGHTTPKVDVRGVVIQDGSILLVKERADGRWTLPGGWVDVGESPSEATVREVYEESGYRTRAVKLLALYDRRKHEHPPHQYHIYKLFFQCEITGGEPTTSSETEGVGFFREDRLPELSVGRVTEAQIARFFEFSRHPDWPTDFD
jgi:ADP-ribose pyrophosphatase YjhB (NUDIX family)